MISAQDRQHAAELIEEARASGARLEPTCGVLGITARTHQRWTREGERREDQRPFAQRPVPSNALTAAEEQEILAVCHRPAFARLPPEQIVVRLLDEEHCYLASVSSFYRVLRRHGELTHRGRAKAPKRCAPPTTYQAKAPNQVWSWDCTWLPGPAKGTYYYLVMILDIYSRKVVGWEAFLAESALNARTLIERAVLAEKVIDKPLVLHADNGSPFKGATLLTEAAVTTDVVPAAGEAVVGVALGSGQLPGEPLLPGDRVLIVQTPRTGDDLPDEPPPGVEATVLRTYPPAGPSDPLVVDVLVAEDEAGVLAGHVATGRVGVVLMSRER